MDHAEFKNKINSGKYKIVELNTSLDWVLHKNFNKLME
jgi:hypothetical protein